MAHCTCIYVCAALIIHTTYVWFNCFSSFLFWCCFSRHLSVRYCSLFLFILLRYLLITLPRLAFVCVCVRFCFAVLRQANAHSRTPLVCVCLCACEFIISFFFFFSLSLLLLFSQHKLCEAMHKEWYGYTQYGSRCFDLDQLPQY